MALFLATFALPTAAEKSNLITDPDAWAFQKFGTANATFTREDDGLKVVIAQTDGTDWHVQLGQNNVALSEGQSYVLTFRAKADAPRPITVRGSYTQPDYHDIGLNQTVALNTEWHPYRMPFTASRLVPGQVSVPQFFLGAAAGTVWLSDIALVAHVTPKLQAPPAPSTLPRRGEISLGGSIRALVPQPGQFVMWVTQVVTPDGKAQNFDPPRLKAVRLLATAKMSAAGTSRVLPRTALKVGDAVTVIGADRGPGLTLPARQLWAATPPL